MFKRILIVSFLMSGVAHNALASSSAYNLDSTLSYTASKHGDTVEVDEYHVSLAYLFGAHQPNDYPLAEHQFIQRRHLIRASYKQEEETRTSLGFVAFDPSRPFSFEDGIDVASFETKRDRDRLELAADYYFKAAPVFIGLAYAETEEGSVRLSQAFALASDIGPLKYRSFALGGYLQDQTRLTLRYQDSRQLTKSGPVELSFQPIAAFFTQQESESKEHAWSLAAKHLQPMSTGHIRVDLKMSMTEIESRLSSTTPSVFGRNSLLRTKTSGIKSYGIGAYYYPTRHIGVGASYRLIDHSVFGANSYAINGEWFMTEKIALSALYAKQDPKFSQTTDVYSLSLNWRF